MAIKRVNKKLLKHFQKIKVKASADPGGGLLSYLQALNKKRESFLEVFREDFEKTGNPLAAWDAYLLAREDGKPVPEWVLEYFDMVGKRLLKTSKHKATDLPHCLGFQRGAGPGPWKQYRDYRIKQTAMAFVMRRAVESPDVSIDDICTAAVEVIADKWGVKIEWDTIKRWYYERDKY